MATKKKKEVENTKTILVVACNTMFNEIDSTSVGEELSSVTMVAPTVKEALKDFKNGDVDYTSQDPQDPDAEHDCIYEVTIKKLGAIRNDVHLG